MRQVELRVHLGQPAVDDQVLVRIRDAQLVGVDVAQHRPDERRAAGSAGTLASSMIAPSAESRDRRLWTSIARTAPLRDRREAIAAAAPAAWPMAMHWAIERTEAWASWVAEKHRPATRTLTASRTTSAANGMPTAAPSGRYAQRVSGPARWSSIGAPHRPIWSSNWRADTTSSRLRRASPYTRRVSRIPICVPS